MSEWQKVKIGDFLTERKGKYKPNDEAILDLKRLNKIDFKGNIHLSEKPTKTNMIIVNQGDLVISGINVAKGAIAVYQGEEPITATIHYSAYQFDESIIDIDFLKRFLKSPAFIKSLQEQVKGGIKTEIKAKTLLSVSVLLPDLTEQQAINKRFSNFENELVELDSEISNQQTYLTQLRQAILQEAIEGKLTADWRVKNPVKKGNPDFDAAALLENIKAEKQKLIAEGKIKKSVETRLIASLPAGDVPFALPDGWIWVRLGEVGLFERGKSKHRPRNDLSLFNNGDIPFIQTGDVSQSKKNNGIIEKADKFYNNNGLSQSRLWNKGTLCITIAANIAETGFLGINACFPDSVVGFTSLSGINTSWFIKHYLFCIQDEIIKFAPATAQKNINLEIIGMLKFPLPPLAEQHAIVERVDRLMNHVDALEKQAQMRKTYAEQLMQTVLKEAFAD